jgi:uncharacterized protein
VSTQENVELVRRSFELYSERGVDAARATWSQGATWHDPPDFPDAAAYEGADAVARRLNELLAILPLEGLEIEEAVAIGDDRVLMILDFHAEGGGSGVPVDQPMGCIVTVADGKITEWRPFLSHEAARKAAGLSR